MDHKGFACAALLCAAATLAESAPAVQLAGSVVQWGGYVVPFVEPETRFNAIASGSEYTFLALKTDGTVIAWGQNGYDAATVPRGLSNVVAVCQATHSLALRSDGTVVAWGDNNEGQATVPPGLTNIVAISAAYP